MDSNVYCHCVTFRYVLMLMFPIIHCALRPCADVYRQNRSSSGSQRPVVVLVFNSSCHCQFQYNWGHKCCLLNDYIISLYLSG